MYWSQLFKFNENTTSLEVDPAAAKSKNVIIVIVVLDYNQHFNTCIHLKVSSIPLLIYTHAIHLIFSHFLHASKPQYILIRSNILIRPTHSYLPLILTSPTNIPYSNTSIHTFNIAQYILLLSNISPPTSCISIHLKYRYYKKCGYHHKNDLFKEKSAKCPCLSK